MDVLIWGTGQGSRIAIEVTKQLQWNIIAFIDSDTNKQDTLYCGKIIISPANINNSKFRTSMIILGTACREVEDLARGYMHEVIAYDMLLKMYRGMCPEPDYYSIQLAEDNLKKCRLLPDRLKMLECIKMDFKEAITIAEIGVAFGDFSQEIMQRCNPRKFFLIDAWLGERYERGLNMVKGRFADEINNGRVEILRGYSTEKLEEMEDNALDVAYIDTVHDYDTTWKELLLCKDKVKENGYIAGHDYVKFNHMSRLYYGVYDAVNRFAVEFGYEFVYMTMEKEGLHSFCLRRLSK